MDNETKKKIILQEEYTLAREVALGIIIKKPLRPWLYIIPGMFIVDYLRRGKEIRIYSNHYLFPRRLALEIAIYKVFDSKYNEKLSGIDLKIADRLQTLNVISDDITKYYKELIKTLTEHYRSLYQIEGRSHNDLLVEAYKSRSKYQQFINKLFSIESKLDNTLAQIASKGLRESLILGLNQLEIMRAKCMDKIF